MHDFGILFKRAIRNSDTRAASFFLNLKRVLMHINSSLPPSHWLLSTRHLTNFRIRICCICFGAMCWFPFVHNSSFLIWWWTSVAGWDRKNEGACKREVDEPSSSCKTQSSGKACYSRSQKKSTSCKNCSASRVHWKNRSSSFFILLLELVLLVHIVWKHSSSHCDRQEENFLGSIM